MKAYQTPAQYARDVAKFNKATDDPNVRLKVASKIADGCLAASKDEAASEKIRKLWADKGAEWFQRALEA